MTASSPSQVVEEVLVFEDLPFGSLASRRVVARWSDGSEGEGLRWYGDEILMAKVIMGTLGLCFLGLRCTGRWFGPGAEGPVSRAELAMRACRARDVALGLGDEYRGASYAGQMAFVRRLWRHSGAGRRHVRSAARTSAEELDASG